MTTRKIVGVKITGVLKQWQRKGEYIKGTMKDSDDFDIEVNFRLKYSLVHYPEGKDNPEYYLARTSLGVYYYLALEEEVHG